MSEFDLIIRNGMVVDGTGKPAFEADVAIDGDRIVAIGDVSGRGRDEIDATGLIVTPGFVDIHTHYDGQATWESRMSPSSSHGVTTVVTGNCGVGFAPCKPENRERLVALMEGVEDIPEIVMTEGLPWAWETFPQYLDFLEQRSYDVDIATQLPHSCLRIHVMGERGARLEPATGQDLALMTELTAEALRAGAIGVGTSRSIFHRFPDGSPVPTKDAGEAELRAIGAGIRAAGHGVFEVLIDQEILQPEFEMMCRISQEFGAPFTFTLMQTMMTPEVWSDGLRLIEKAQNDNIAVKGQIIGRPTGILLGLDLSLNPFSLYPSFMEIADLPVAEKLARLRTADFRARLLAESPRDPQHPIQKFLTAFHLMFPLGNPPVYEPAPDSSVAAQAQAAGVSPQEIAYDLLLEDNGQALLFSTAGNYADLNLDACLTMLKHPHTVLGLGDGGAHYGMICDAGYPTFMLTHWTRDRSGEKLGLEAVIKALSLTPARTVGLNDRGILAPGYRADVNVIDYEGLYLDVPRVKRDLPAGGRRLKQAAKGYMATILRGKVTYRDGVETAELPGRLVRGVQQLRIPA